MNTGKDSRNRLFNQLLVNLGQLPADGDISIAENFTHILKRTPDAVWCFKHHEGSGFVLKGGKP